MESDQTMVKCDIKALIQSLDKVAFYTSRVPGLEPCDRKWTKKVRCPFCDGERPTFTVNFHSGAFKCFREDRGGDPISFLMRFENINFKTALDRLRSGTKIDWPAIRRRERERKRKKMIDEWLVWFRELVSMRMSWAARMAVKDGCDSFRIHWRRWTDILEIIDADPGGMRKAERFYPGIGEADKIEAEKMRLFEYYGGDR